MQGEIRTMQSLRQHCLRQVRGYDLSPQGTPLRWLFVAKIGLSINNLKLIIKNDDYLGKVLMMSV